MFPNPYTNSKWMRESHPFLLEVAEELKKLGCECIKTPRFPSLTWILFNRKKLDVLHVHWPEQYYELAWHSENRLLSKILGVFDFTAPLRRVLGFGWLFAFVHLLRLTGIPLLWTVHDLFPHTSQSPSKLQLFARQYLLKHTEVLLLNCENAAGLVEKELGQAKNVVVAPLGDYKLFYPETTNRQRARQLFRLSENESMFLFFGSQRPHRNAQELIRSFGEIPDPSVHLWVVGYTPENIRAAEEELNWSDWRVHLHLRQVSNQQVEYAIKACDFLVMPGKNYLTSAVAVLALSYGIPVIAPHYGCAKDMVGDAGILYDDTQPDGLKDAMEYALNNKESLQNTARQQISRWSWQITAEQTYKAYQLAIKHKPAHDDM
ncbi:D-inositol 3-phosphate glycosyltransferase [Anaerolineales bacterium]|nr:D-inositol 3-phosphate glycosyltransferase [Anaerolineales bacterium]